MGAVKADDGIPDDLKQALKELKIKAGVMTRNPLDKEKEKRDKITALALKDAARHHHPPVSLILDNNDTAALLPPRMPPLNSPRGSPKKSPKRSPQMHASDASIMPYGVKSAAGSGISDNWFDQPLGTFAPKLLTSNTPATSSESTWETVLKEFPQHLKPLLLEYVKTQNINPEGMDRNQIASEIVKGFVQWRNASGAGPAGGASVDTTGGKRDYSRLGIGGMTESQAGGITGSVSAGATPGGVTPGLQAGATPMGFENHGGASVNSLSSAPMSIGALRAGFQAGASAQMSTQQSNAMLSGMISANPASNSIPGLQQSNQSISQGNLPDRPLSSGGDMWLSSRNSGQQQSSAAPGYSISHGNAMSLASMQESMGSMGQTGSPRASLARSPRMALTGSPRQSVGSPRIQASTASIQQSVGSPRVQQSTGSMGGHIAVSPRAGSPRQVPLLSQSPRLSQKGSPKGSAKGSQVGSPKGSVKSLGNKSNRSISSKRSLKSSGSPRYILGDGKPANPDLIDDDDI